MTERVAAADHLSSISRTAVTDEIVERLVGLILDEGLEPGEQLPPERELMARLSVGRSSLREAVRTLRAIGVVEVSPGVGTFVGRGDTSILTKPLSWGLFLSVGSAKQVVEARRLIEVELAGLGAERATDEEIAAISRRLDDMAAAGTDRHTYVELDLLLHLAIARAAHNDVLYYVVSALQHASRVWMQRVFLDDGSVARSLASHGIIYRAICARDVGAARAAMAEHLEGTRILAVVGGTEAGGKPRGKPGPA